MPHKDRDDGPEERPSERRQRLKAEKDANRPHKSSRSSRPKVIDPETGEPVRSSHRRRKEKEMDSEDSPSLGEVVPELAKTPSAPEMTSRESFPYPSFSKAHSKEAVNSKEEIKPIPMSRAAQMYTPDPTDLGSGDTRRTKSADPPETKRKGKEHEGSRPLTPPDTEILPQRKTTPSSIVQDRDNSSQARPSSQTSQRSWFGRPRERDDRSRVSTKSKGSIKSKGSKTSTAVRTSKAKVPKAATVEDATSTLSEGAESNSAIDSNATSVPKRETPAPGDRPPTLDPDVSPESSHSSSPRTPVATPKLHSNDLKPTPSPFVSFDVGDSQDEAYDSPQPPPPPPPPMVPMNIPRVDYLMQNGGLNRMIPKTLLAVTPMYPSLTHDSARIQAISGVNVEKVFGPFHNLLEQYESVLNKGGSIAVATGYRSVARRLLDRLENVFARDLSSEGCSCVMCQQLDRASRRGLGWGEVLEWVSDRRELPAWPPFDFSTMGVNPEDLAALGITDGDFKNDRPPRPRSPVKIDPDVAEEFHQHYLRQSKKTRSTVATWLSSTPSTTGGVPADIDDETLTFSILTHLNNEERPIFSALLTGSQRPIPPTARAPTPVVKARSDFIIKTGLSLQRLYRLPTAPRDPESCIYLLRNPEMHNLLTTLSGINNSEWEILTSGRFDGFLWSGAESEFPGSLMNSPGISRGPTPANGVPSRGPTPAQRHPSISRITSPLNQALRSNTFSPVSRGPTPSSFMAGASVPSTPAQQARHPVSNDEETEIAILAEVEREIYVGMEALEDAFEALHRKAEFVRRALRERGAGLSMAAQTRGSPGDVGAFARLGTPGFNRVWQHGGNGTESDADPESDWGGEDGFSELAPDDSASNISSSRVRRPKRRNERRTPAPVEEEVEE